ncbi:hypothetical protein Tsubulata_024657 [Turnera subulata]|uniref:Glycosyltransferase n=1 Tax=Turnera subulata TaxID=218843 RepID=A0A9Q0JEK5_9ROSI|nr:hypothetical protein Tsubulata_024657 [Turnera subulata]
MWMQLVGQDEYVRECGTKERQAPDLISISRRMADNSKLHIAMFPWLAFGHMIPYLELAKLIAQKGHKISFISTPRNIDRLPKLPPHIAPLINLVKLPLPRMHNLLEGAEATSEVPYDKVKYLKQAYDGLKEPLATFLETSRPDWILNDFLPFWLPEVASRLGISNAFFSIFIAAALSIIKPQHVVEYRTTPEDYAVPANWIPFPTTVAFRLFEVLKLFDHSISVEETHVTDMYRFEEVIKGCDLIAVRGSKEFAPEWMQLLEELHGKPVLPVGFLPTTEYDDGEETETWRSVKEWLDKQEKGKVVYVAFGSEAKPSQDELTEIALGLELSGLPFFWVLKKRRGLEDTEPIELPDGFEERTKGRGIVCITWAPQLKILGHDSVGGFLTHSGWSSVVEALQNQRALILLTFLADQGLNARVLEENRIAYSIPRNHAHGSFTRDSVAESLRLVIAEEEGKFYRDKAKEMSSLFGDRDRQDRYVDNLLGYLQSHVKQLKS